MNQPHSAQARGFFHPAGKPYRFVILFFVSMLTFGSYFAYDIIGAIAPRLVEELGAARGTVGAFYTVYSIAAIISVLLGGFLIDYLGTRKASMLFSVLVFIGAALVALANSIEVLFIGRFIFGAGSEPLVVAQSAILSRWFKGKELALSFGIALTVSRLGTLFSFNMGELIATHYGGYKYALIAATLFCLISLIANLVYIIMDRRGEKILQLEDEGAEEKIDFSVVKNFKASFWYIAMLCVLFYSAIFPFTALSTDFFVDKWQIAKVAESSGGFFAQAFNNFLHMFSTAGGISSIIIFASMVFAPFAGHLVDKVGRRASLMIVGSILLIPSYLMLALTNIYPAYSMIILGAAFVLVPAAMWPSVPLIVKKEQVGTAFGLITFIQNIGLALFPYLNGKLRDVTHSYTASMLMFASLGIFGLIFAFLLKKADSRESGILERAE
ncbi:MAG TPA: MFS transporter [Caldithrix abyssi]|uniref:Lysosomal dipeptide transporter MFSD1 n=1 Tax=Caldithrix abyssi TaxID=187145 RepID=A0A7V4U046_CALAY|nr:MFS transporter [Caldithrix abyssi]